MKLLLDLDCWFEIAQVGSSIHGDLLSPNDIDIVLCYKLPFFTSTKPVCFRLGKFNFIVLHNNTIFDYVNEFDMNILRGYKKIFSRELVLFPLAFKALDTKHIKQLMRKYSVFEIYDKEVYRESLIIRATKYMAKLPEGWTFSPLPEVRREMIHRKIEVTKCMI